MKKPIKKLELEKDLMNLVKIVGHKQLNGLKLRGLATIDILFVIIEDRLNEVIDRVNELYDNKK